MGVLILFISKLNGKLCLYIHYHELNAVTMKNSYPLPLMDKLRDQVVGCE
jgi:hypothetical protein